MSDAKNADEPELRTGIRTSTRLQPDWVFTLAIFYTPQKNTVR